MKVLFLTDGITPYNTGGMQKHSYVMSKLLAHNNCEVTLVHCGFFNKKEFYEDYTKIFTAEELKKITPLFIPFVSEGKLPGHYITESKTYSNLIKNHIGINSSKFDLIYAQGFTGWSFLNNNQNIPVVVNLHGFEMFQKAPSNRVKMEHYLLRPFVKKILKGADFVLSFGGQIDQILFDLAVDPSKIVQQSNGIQEDWIRSTLPTTSKTRTFTFIGRYERRKGIEELTAALSELLNDNLDFQFNFIGPIPEKYQLPSPRVNYLGEIKDSTVIIDMLDKSDYLVAPSYSEGMPTVILEAMARGNAIITTDVGANSKLIDQNGWLIQSSPTSIKEAISKGISIDNSKLLSMKKTSLAKVRLEFTWETVIQQQLSELKKISKK